jgi:hypothetical protein
MSIEEIKSNIAFLAQLVCYISVPALLLAIYGEMRDINKWWKEGDEIDNIGKNS